MTKISKESQEWAQQAFDKLKNKKEPKFRSKLEESVASLLEGLGVSYEYESEKIPYIIQHHYTPISYYRIMYTWKLKDIGLLKTAVKS